MSGLTEFRKILIENKKTGKSGMYSICSSHPDVIKAGLHHAKEEDSFICIESTSNQVDQFGGYTGMTPMDFVSFVKDLAAEANFPEDKILLGGDHLGPNRWKNLTVEEAMNNARGLIRAYVQAGFLKIHLDTSMRCADDPGDRHTPLSDSIVSERTADLCSVAEETWFSCNEGPSRLLYIIGTEVPVPGGAEQPEETIAPTSGEDALKTVEVTKEAFYRKNLQGAWDRVVALVVQPGVEFGDDTVFHYRRSAAEALSKSLNNIEGLIFEAHSTDYQSQENLSQLVEDHFGILKVGPWLTFAYRESLFALEEIEIKLLSERKDVQLSGLQETLERVMLQKPEYWKPYYQGSLDEQRIKRKYSFSDRSRYYWNDKNIADSIELLKKNLRKNRIPLSILSQYLPAQYTELMNGIILNDPDELINSKIRAVLRIYSSACKS